MSPGGREFETDYRTRFDDFSDEVAPATGRTNFDVQWGEGQYSALPGTGQLDKRRRYVIPETQSASLEMRYYRLQQSVSPPPPPTSRRNPAPANRQDTTGRHSANQRDDRSASPPRVHTSQQGMPPGAIPPSYGPPPPPAIAGALPSASSTQLPGAAPLRRQVEALGTARSGNPGVPAPASERPAVKIQPIQELYKIRDARESARGPQPPVEAAPGPSQLQGAPPARSKQTWHGYDQLPADCLRDGRHYCPQQGCGLSYLDRTRLQRHWRKQHCDGKPFTCTVGQCGMRLATRDELSDHIQTHDNHGRFFCPGCKSPYKTKWALNVHRKKKNKNPECNLT